MPGSGCSGILALFQKQHVKSKVQQEEKTVKTIGPYFPNYLGGDCGESTQSDVPIRLGGQRRLMGGMSGPPGL